MRWLRRFGIGLVVLLSTCSASAGFPEPHWPGPDKTSPSSPLYVVTPATSADWLAELIPGMDYGAWYTLNTHHGISDFFAAYAVAPLENTLYAGFGTARPGESDGALLASSDGITITAVYTPTEQGFIDMTVISDTVYFPGPDPCCGDGWDWGNFYTWPSLNPKHRNLPNILHSWGEWYDLDQDTLYVAVGGCHEGIQNPNAVTCEGNYLGKVLGSTDGAETWTEIARGDVQAGGIGRYRTYDIMGFNDKLYVVWNDVYENPCGLAESADEGNTWTRIPDLSLQATCRTRLAVYQGLLLIARADRAAIFAVGLSGSITAHELPGFEIADWAYNYLAEDGNGRLYTITDDGRVLRTADLETWETLISRDLSLTTVGYWPERDWLVVGDRGPHAKLWKIDLSASSAITIPEAPAVSATRSGDALRLDWPDVTLDVVGQPAAVDGYLVYRSADPHFRSHVSNRIASPPVSECTDEIIGDGATNYFYLVRTVDETGNLSANANRVGAFTFAIVPGD